MKKANIYKVSVKDKEGNISKVTCVAVNVEEAITAVAPAIYNSETGKCSYLKYTPKDIVGIELQESDVYVQSYIEDNYESE